MVGLNSTRMLVLDPQIETNMDILTRKFNSFGIYYEVKSSYQELLARLSEANGMGSPIGQFDLLIINGASLDEEREAQLSAYEIPVVWLVTHTQIEEHGGDRPNQLIKPVTPKNLLQTLNKALALTTNFASNAFASPNAMITQDWDLSTIADANILLVEDNPINQQVAKEMLVTKGLNVDVAFDGHEAQQLLIDRKVGRNYDLVLMDIQMPKVDGYQATRQIREHSEFADLPIVAMTANALNSDHEKSLAAGMNAHLDKPIIPEKLFEVLLRFIPATRYSSSEPENLKTPEPAQKLETMSKGLDLEKGLQRLNGNKPLQLKLLKEFYENNRRFPVVITNLIKLNQRRELVKQFHTLSGSASNLGAQNLAEQATRIQKAIENHHCYDGLLIEFQVHFGGVMAEMLNYLKLNESGVLQSQSSDSSDFEGFLELANQLEPMLIQGNSRCSTLLTQMHKLLTSQYKKDLVVLEQLVDECEFEQANAGLKKLQQRIAATNKAQRHEH
ncbi:MAG: response regulator [Motiliproteus sp.]|nr:response regulator [Motiliproteus sp.]